MSEIKTAGDLRSFLADVLEGIKDGKVSVDKAGAISKVAAQINQSLAVEVSAALQLRRMEQTRMKDVTLSIDGDNMVSLPKPDTWCEQCEMRVSTQEAAECKSKFCKAKPADA